VREKKGEIFFGWEGKLSVCRCNWNVFWGQIFNLDNGGEIEEKAKKDRALGLKNSKDSKSQFSRIKI